MKNDKGITLVALVITVIVLIILASVSINLITGGQGLITKAEKVKANMQISINEEEIRLEEIKEYNNKDIQIAEKNQPNSPKLLDGMIPVKYIMPTADAKGSVVETTVNDSNWYEYGTTYETRRWANAVTKDSKGEISGYFVWIPRFAYKISGTKISIAFLIGTTDQYYNEEGKLKTAQRQTSLDQTINTTLDYTVHPAFTDERNINFANGGWDKELSGIWVAKFEAGYASGNNNVEVKASNVNYTNQLGVLVAGIERARNEDGTTKSDGSEDARNWLDGIYGSATNIPIKYPVFIPTTYSMNYINHNDSFNVSKALTENGNIYGLNSVNADSHLMKNSEWGAVIYLSQSIYGQNGTEIKVTNASLDSGRNPRTATGGQTGVNSVYAVTGCTSNETTRGGISTTIGKINEVTENEPTEDTYGIYTWNQLSGQNASTTGTIYGIYDMSGGMWERTASYIANGNTNLKTYGESIAYNGDTLKTESTKYTMVYPYQNPEFTVLDIASQTNFAINTKIYGDAIRETTSSNAGTSQEGWNKSSWNNDYSIYLGKTDVFLERGASWGSNTSAGLFSFIRANGSANYNSGFRPVIIAK